MKTCRGCGQAKPPEDFAAYLNKCHACANQYQRDRRRKLADHYRAVWRQNRAKNLLKARARETLRKAIRKGSVTRAPCEVCGAKGQAHHEDYARPLDVRWLCVQHHRDAHKA